MPRRYIATLDGDGQNNPAFIPAMIRLLEAGEGRVGIVQASAWAARIPLSSAGSPAGQSRACALLKDGTRDTGCGLKAFPRGSISPCPISTRSIGSCRPW